jgi:protocatechuate 3,4-dioxygenase beta subunit
MRRLLSISLLFAGSLCAQPAGVSGIVVDQNGKPLAAVHVRLVNGDLNGNEGVDAVYGATTDSAGQFTFEALDPKLYLVMAERGGFIQRSTGGMTMLALKPGQHLTDYKIAITAQAVITGRVVDEFGDPVQQIQVELQAVKKEQENFLFTRGNGTIDDRGEFRVTAMPGKYYIKASPWNRFPGPPEIRTDGTSGAPFETTYFPSAASADAASVVEVGAGQERSDIEIRMLRAGPASVRAFTISGVVTGVPENGTANVMLRFGETEDEFHTARGTGAGSDGRFQFTGMQPGFYSVAASFSTGKTPLQSRAKKFHLESADETGIELVLAPGEDLSGKVEFTGDAVAGDANRHTVRLEAAGWGDQYGQWESPTVEVGADGSFHIAGVPPGKFNPVVEPMPENGYLKEVSLDGKAQPEQMLDFSQGVGGSRVKVTVSRNGGQISGKILGADGEQASGLVWVFMGTDAKHLDEDKAAKTTDGKYSFKTVRPGTYRLIAVDIAAMTQLINRDDDNDEAMQQLFDAAEEIEVKEGDHLAKDLTAVTKPPEKKEAR